MMEDMSSFGRLGHLGFLRISLKAIEDRPIIYLLCFLQSFLGAYSD